MKEEIVIAGFGGQGVVFSGEILAWAAMLEGKQVTMVSSYGAETRGGTVNVQVTLADQKIGSPFVEHPDSLLVMNSPSLERFEAAVKMNGLIVLNTSLINAEPKRNNVKILKIKANEIAQLLGYPGLANMVMLGAYLEEKRLLQWKSIFAALGEVLTKRNKLHLAEINKKALWAGAEKHSCA